MRLYLASTHNCSVTTSRHQRDAVIRVVRVKDVTGEDINAAGARITRGLRAVNPYVIMRQST